MTAHDLPAPRTYAIIGVGGHARVVQDVLLQRDKEIYPAIHSDKITDDLDSLYLGIGNAAKVGDPGLTLRRELYNKFAERIDKLIAPSAVCRVIIYRGAQVLSGAVVNVGTVIGENVIVNTGAIVEHDCFVGDHSHIAPGAVLCGGARVGMMTHIGARAVVKQGVRVGSGCVVGMGAVVRKDVADGETVW